MNIDLRKGLWQFVLDGVECDALITDPPYSERTHKNAIGACDLTVGVKDYVSWDEVDAREFIDSWAPRTKGWIVIHTDDILAPAFRRAMEQNNRVTFTMIPVIQPGPRVTGDGPATCGHFLVVSRPRGEPYSKCGSLPSHYRANRSSNGVRGGKPMELMRAIINDYTQKGDLVCDPCAGAGTTLLAAAVEGRRGIGAEKDEGRYKIAMERIGMGPLFEQLSIVED